MDDLEAIHGQVAARAIAAMKAGDTVTGPHMRDDTPVPAWIIPALKQYAAAVLHHKVVQRHTPIERDRDVVGRTITEKGGHGRILIRAGLSDADKARTIVHEAVHAKGRRTGRKLDYLATTLLGGDPREEILAESAAAIVCTALGITDGKFTAAFIAGHLADKELLAEVKPGAVSAARRILAGIGA
jgi:hypothetical protein